MNPETTLANQHGCSTQQAYVDVLAVLLHPPFLDQTAVRDNGDLHTQLALAVVDQLAQLQRTPERLATRERHPDHVVLLQIRQGLLLVREGEMSGARRIVRARAVARELLFDVGNRQALLRMEAKFAAIIAPPLIEIIYHQIAVLGGALGRGTRWSRPSRNGGHVAAVVPLDRRRRRWFGFCRGGVGIFRRRTR